jgi:trimeric autotransporter adhesin
MPKTNALLLGLTLFALPPLATAQNTISTVAGGGSLNGSALTADLGVPTGVVKDGLGNTYVTSFSEHTVFKLTPFGQWSVFAGIGRFGFSGDGGPAINAALYAPAGIAIDSSGNVFIVEVGNRRVRRVDAVTGVITTFAGNGSAGVRGQPNGDGGAATSASLEGPRALAMDSAGNVYIADSDGAVIRKVDNTAQHIITTVAGNGTLGSRLLPDGDGGPATSANLNFPRGVAVDSLGNLYIADSRDYRIRKVDTSAQHIITTYEGNGAPETAGQPNGDGGPATGANLTLPRGVAVDASGNLFIADSGDQVVRKVDTSAQHIITTVAGNGAAAFTGDGGPALSASLNGPFALFIDAAGAITIVDAGNLRVRVVDTNLNISTVAGGGNGGDGGLATNAILAEPVELALDVAGNLYISDYDNERVRRVSAGPSPTISTYAGTGVGAGTIGNGVPAQSADLVGPAGLTFDPTGNLLFVNEGDGFYTGIVQRVDTLSGTISIVAGDPTGVGGSSPCGLKVTTDPCGDGGSATLALFYDPWSVAVDASGNIFISDIGLNRVRRVDAVTNIITTVAGTGTPCADGTTACGDGGLATNANLNSPYGIAFDPAGNLLIVDSGDNKIRRVNAIGGMITASSTITTVAFNGAATFGGNGGPALNASLRFPLGVRADSAGNLFISGSVDNVVQRVDAISGTIATVAGDVNNLAGGFSGDGGPATQASLGIFGLTIDNAGGLYIADQANNRIRYVHLTPVASLSGSFSDFGIVSVGTASLPQTISITNTGSATLSITNITVTGNFGASLTCKPATVAPLQSCGVQAFFTPGLAGPQTGTLSFSTNDATHSSYSFNLSGTGFAGPTLGVSPTTLAFGNQIVSTTSPAQTVTIANTGATNVTISSVAISGANPTDFAESNNCPLSPAALTPGNSCDIFVTYAPIALGARTASLVITDTQGNAVNAQQSVSLTGTGTDVPVVASTTYRITGNPFTTFTGSAVCPPDCNISGSFTLAQPLPPNLSNATITPISFSFTVGIANLTQANATSATFAGISTDASGYITGWAISLSNANFSIVTNNEPDNVADSFTIAAPQGSASNANSPASWPKTVVTPVTFNASPTPVSNIATINCPSGTVPCPDPNAHSLKLTVPAVSSGFTLTITSVEVPLSEANGVCEAGHTDANDFDCRLVSNFTLQVKSNGDIVVPQCIPYSNGNCVFYRVSNTPPETSYTAGVLEYIAWNNTSYTPPPFYNANNPRLLDDPDDPPYDANHQFVFDITDYYKPTGNYVGVDNGIGGGTQHFNDFIVAYPATPSYAYALSFALPLSSTQTAHFEQGDSITAKFKLIPNTPPGIATQSPNHVGYSVLLDTNRTGCNDFSGTLQPTATPLNSPVDFTYDTVRQRYQLRLRGIYGPGQYKLLLSSNLAPEQCAVFAVTKDN